MQHLLVVFLLLLLFRSTVSVPPAVKNRHIDCFLRLLAQKPINTEDTNPFPTYLTHAAKFPRRLHHAFNTLKVHNLSPQVITQYDKEEITPDVQACVLGYPDTHHRWSEPLWPARVSLFIKHYVAFYDLIRKGQPWGVVFEDDATIHMKVNLTAYVLDLQKQLPPAWDFVMLGGGGDCDAEWIKPNMSEAVTVVTSSTDETTKLVRNKWSRCTHAYMFSAAAALKMLSWLPMTSPIDWQMNNIADDLPINKFWIEPFIVHQSKLEFTGVTIHE